MREYVKDDIEQISRDKAIEASDKLLELLLEHHGEDEDDPPLQRVTIEAIQIAVAASYDVTRTDMLSERRNLKIIMPRQVAMYLCRELTLRSLPAIGRRFGHRDHSTISHAHDKIARLVLIDFVLAAKVETIRAGFEP